VRRRVSRDFRKHNADHLISWFKCIDCCEYIDDALTDKLCGLDINDPRDQVVIIELAFLPEYRAMPNASKRSMRNLLAAAPGFEDAAIQESYDRVTDPFPQRLRDIRGFLQRLQTTLDAIESIPAND